MGYPCGMVPLLRPQRAAAARGLKALGYGTLWFVFGSAVLLAGALTFALFGASDALAAYLPFLPTHEAKPAQERAAASAPVPTKPRVPRVVYLNREGALLTAGVDDASKNQSSLVRSAKHASVAFAPFEGSHAQWTGVVECVRDRFKPFAIDIVDQRPVEPGYMMAMFGGTAKQFDAAQAIAGEDHEHSVRTGLSPFNGETIPGAVVLIFAKTLGNAPRSVCETAGMEIGHAYGLDHEMDCHDLMTYLPLCGPRRFVDKAVACGEQNPRECRRGGALQNSHAHLLQILGPR
jgi:hypothetical protein